MDEYKINERDLESLNCVVKKNPHYSSQVMYLYLEDEVQVKFKKRKNIKNYEKIFSNRVQRSQTIWNRTRNTMLSSLIVGRRYIGIEIKNDYFDQSILKADVAEEFVEQFDIMNQMSLSQEIKQVA